MPCVLQAGGLTFQTSRLCPGSHKTFTGGGQQAEVFTRVGMKNNITTSTLHLLLKDRGHTNAEGLVGERTLEGGEPLNLLLNLLHLTH